MGAVNSFLERRKNRRMYDDQVRKLGNTDVMFDPVATGVTADFGDYTLNNSVGTNFRPNSLYTRDQGNNTQNRSGMGYFQEGGEYELTEEEIQQILKNGGEIEYL